ncbi:MAG: hypothetical protein KGN01_06565 [Patescibacteria group bacterium]|nr:hypothetical protein [Patescibacteria group bacterium]
MIRTFVLLTAYGEGYAAALQAKLSGCDVVVGMVEDIDMIQSDDELNNPNYKKESAEDKKRRLSTYEGILKHYPIQKVVDTLLSLSDDEKEDYFVYSDMNYVWRYSQQLEGKGIAGNFPNEEDRILENDRKAAKDFVKKNYEDVHVQDVKEYSNIEEATKDLEGTYDIYVLKGNDAEAETVVPQKNDSRMMSKKLIKLLKRNRKEYEKGGFILEKKIIDPIEITPQLYFWNGEPVYSTIDIELKHRYAGDQGEMIGCAANLVFETDMQCRLNKMAFPKAILDKYANRQGLSMIDCGILIDPVDGRMYFTEYCTRFGYDQFYTELEMVGGIINWCETIAQGQNPMPYKNGKFGMGVRWMNTHKEEDYAQELDVDVESNVADHVWLYWCKMEGGTIKTCGYADDIALITASGDTIEDATNRVFSYAQGFDCDDATARPVHDILSLDYPGSIMNRYNYILSRGLLEVGDVPEDVFKYE